MPAGIPHRFTLGSGTTGERTDDGDRGTSTNKPRVVGQVRVIPAALEAVYGRYKQALA